MARQSEKLAILRATLMSRIKECNAAATPLRNSTDIRETCRSIELSGWAQGLAEALEALDEVIFSGNPANDNTIFNDDGGDIAS